MKSIKKAVAIFLSLVMIVCAVPLCTIAAGGFTPTVYIIGIASYDITNEAGEVVFPPSTDEIKTAIANNLPALLSLKGDALGDAVAGIALELFEEAALTDDGELVDGIGVDWEYPAINKSNPQSVYTFVYDWRQDPIESARELSDFVDYLCEGFDCDKVDFIAFSMGAAVFNSYYEYFSNDGEHVESICYLAPAYNGADVCGTSMNEMIAFDADSLSSFVDEMVYGNTGNTVAVALLDALYEAGLYDVLAAAGNGLVDNIVEKVYSALIPTFGTMPGIWCLVPDEYYESAKQLLFGDSGGHDGLVEKIDKYHYEIMMTNEQRLAELNERDDINMGIVVKYDMSNVPVTTNNNVLSDGVLDTFRASNGATCAAQNGTLGEDYAQANTLCGHDHLSADNMIDASTCQFPETTWFVKGLHHASSNSELYRLINYIIKSDAQVTVSDSETFPQFMTYDADGVLVPLTEENAGGLTTGYFEKDNAFARILKTILNVFRTITLMILKVFKK